jgi:AraC-like DNA-binding protein
MRPGKRRSEGSRHAEASRLLETSSAGVAEVAKRVGYDAEAAFSKAFKRWIGVAPGAYRRRAETRSGEKRDGSVS